jgi:hypothetical protein
MAEHIDPIDIGNTPELVRLAEDVHRSHRARIPRRDGEDLAMIVPLPPAGTPQFKKPTVADLEAFRSAAGSWSDIDTDVLIERIYRAREEGTRPADCP